MFRRSLIVLILLFGCFAVVDQPLNSPVRVGRSPAFSSVPAEQERKVAASSVPADLITTSAFAAPSSGAVVSADIRAKAVSLVALGSGREGARYKTLLDENGVERTYQAGMVLLKFKDEIHPAALDVPEGSELEAIQELPQREDVEYAELNFIHTRQFQPNDPGAASQWHHGLMRSTNAWALTIGYQPVTVAIVDTPFQMDHPDLAPNAVAGFDLVRSQAVTSAPGFYHSTIAAGLAGGLINNFIGISGMVNCKLMPIDIGDFPDTAMMYQAVIWAAENGVRVVNLSWDGAFSGTINTGAEYLEQTTRGVVIMSGINGEGLFVNHVNQPKIWAISMTDTADRQRSKYGPHIDFAAPGYDTYSTTENSSYEIDTGTSYSAPLFSGLVAWVMSVNPALDPPAIFELLKQSAIDLGAAGYDQHYGWGRIDFGKLSEKIPLSHRILRGGNGLMIEAILIPGAEYSFLFTDSLEAPQWQSVSNFSVTTNDLSVIFHDLSDMTYKRLFYQLKVRRE